MRYAAETQASKCKWKCSSEHENDQPTQIVRKQSRRSPFVVLVKLLPAVDLDVDRILSSVRQNCRQQNMS